MAPVLSLGALLGLLLDPGGAARVLHSLRYLDMTVSEPGLGVPQFMEIGYLDGIPITRYDSERGRMEPQTPWMAAGAEPGYWDSETRRSERYQHVDAWNLEILRERYSQSGGLHTLQLIFDCDLLSDGSIRGSYRYGYDGRDFLSFELGSRSFVAADGAAQITKRRWDHEGIVAEEWTNYLQHTCVDALQRFFGYGREELERKEAPDVHVSGKVEYGILTLSCHAFGFYPSTIEINWMKGNEVWDQETQWDGVVPNTDGTFHTRARIKARPEEREQYRCRVEHSGMPEPGIFVWEPESSGNLILVVAVSIIAAIVVIVIGFVIWKFQSGKRERNGHSAADREYQESPHEQSTELDPAPFCFPGKLRAASRAHPAAPTHPGPATALPMDQLPIFRV